MRKEMVYSTVKRGRGDQEGIWRRSSKEISWSMVFLKI